MKKLAISHIPPTKFIVQICGRFSKSQSMQKYRRKDIARASYYANQNFSNCRYEVINDPQIKVILFTESSIFLFHQLEMTLQEMHIHVEHVIEETNEGIKKVRRINMMHSFVLILLHCQLSQRYKSITYHMKFSTLFAEILC